MPRSLQGDLTVIFRIGQLYFAERLAPLGLGSWQRNYIVHVCRSPGISQEGLAKVLYVNKSTVARQLAALEEAGFVRRQPSADDARVLEIYPTERAEAALPELRAARREWEALLTEGIAPEEREALGAALAKLRERAAAWAEEERDE